MTTSIISMILMVISSVIGATGSFFFKQASSKINFKLSLLIKNYTLFTGFFFFGIAALLSMIALKYGELNVLYPISSLSYVWSLFIGGKFLDEKINFYKAGGMFLILTGVIFIVR